MTSRRLPPITLAADEADQLAELADAAAQAYPEVAAFLENELSRAAVVSPAKLPADVVRIGSRVRFCDESGALAEVTLVLPNEANVTQGKISVLTPVGAALIGMKEGSSIPFTARRGTRRITVLAVGRQAARAGTGGGA